MRQMLELNNILEKITKRGQLPWWQNILPLVWLMISYILMRMKVANFLCKVKLGPYLHNQLKTKLSISEETKDPLLMRTIIIWMNINETTFLSIQVRVVMLILSQSITEQKSTPVHLQHQFIKIGLPTMRSLLQSQKKIKFLTILYLTSRYPLTLV